MRDLGRTPEYQKPNLILELDGLRFIRTQEEETSTMVEKEVTAASIVEEQIVVKEKRGDICSFGVPADVFGLEILSYLPAKDLQTLKTVCKDWLQLISSSYFIRLHLSRGNRSRIRVLIVGVHFPTIIEYNNYYKKTIQRIAYPPQFSRFTRILGSADSLAYLLDGNSTALFNPSTGKCSGVQIWPCAPKAHHLIFYWFGNLGVGEYVLYMGLLFHGPRYEIWVYKFTRSSNIVNRIRSTQLNNMPCLYPLEEKGTSVQGVVHWPVQLYHSCHRYTILTYYLNKNTHIEISPPAQCDFRLGLFVDGCSLFATFKKNMLSAIELWIMKENCWTKYINIGGSDNFRVLSPLGFFPNGDLMMDANNSQLVKYSFNHNETTLLIEYGIGMHDVVMCADGLVSTDF